MQSSLPRRPGRKVTPTQPEPAQAAQSQQAIPVDPATIPTRKRRRVATYDLKKDPELSDGALAVRALMRLREEATQELTKFYSVVMRHETTKKPLKPAAHQVLMFSFLEHHDKVVFRQPINTAKTFGMAAATLFFTGRDPTSRGIFLSKTQDLAKKPLSMIADYIVQPSLNRGLQVVFPKLRRSTRTTDPWTTVKITVDRPPGIRDATVAAAGLDTGISGARISWLVADDTLDIDNTRTPEARQKAKDDLEGKILSRLDTDTPSKAVFTNTPWDRDDLTYYLERDVGWATMQMDVYGDITITNADASWLHKAEQTLIRPSMRKPGCYRLRAHDPDDGELVPLWPERLTLKKIEELKATMLPQAFSRLYMCEPFNDKDARCQKDWIEKCKKLGIGTSLVDTYQGTNPVFAGLDIGIGRQGKNDLTVFFVFEMLPNRSRKVLWVESGRWSGPDIVKKIGELYDRYHPIMAVESNSAQDFIRQFAVDGRKDLIVHAHNTGSNKHAQDYGVESIFNELQNGAWIIPCDYNGDCHPEVQKWIDNMLFYQPSKHTGDHLMAAWIARERSRKYGFDDPKFTSTAISDWHAQSTRSGF